MHSTHLYQQFNSRGAEDHSHEALLILFWPQKRTPEQSEAKKKTSSDAARARSPCHIPRLFLAESLIQTYCRRVS